MNHASYRCKWLIMMIFALENWDKVNAMKSIIGWGWVGGLIDIHLVMNWNFHALMVRARGHHFSPETDDNLWSKWCANLWKWFLITFDFIVIVWSVLKCRFYQFRMKVIKIIFITLNAQILYFSFAKKRLLLYYRLL